MFVMTRRWLLSNWAVAAAIVTLIALLRTQSVWQDLSNRSFDLMSTVGHPVPAEPGIVLVAIDEPSFSELGMQWPWPRNIHARLIEALRGAGVRAIGFDVLFAESADPAGDAALAAAAGPDLVFAADESVTESGFGTMLIRTEPFPAILENGALSGLVTIPLSGDGVARHLTRYPDAFDLRLLEIAGEPVPQDSGGKRIQYFGPPSTYPRVSYYQALEPEKYLPPGFLKDAVVIVGYTLQASPEVGTSAIDVFETPFTLTTRTLTPGPEVHATIYDNLRHRLWINEPPVWIGLLTLVAGGIAGILASRPNGALGKVGLAIGLVVLCAIGSWLVLRFGRIWLSPAEPIFAIGLTVAGTATRDFASEQRRRREVQAAFAQYISPAMVERLVANPDLLKLGGERKELTILFADIRGFTTISELMKHDPEGLVDLINDIMTPLSEIVIEHGGTIDKYMGDCIMAFWNAPLDDPDHPRHAVAAAQAMLAAMPAINEAIGARLPERDGDAGKPQVRIGIGINTGECVVGNMGSTTRFDYSVLGDTVNTASRLEGKCKEYGVPIVIGEVTAAAIGDAFALTEIDRMAVRGKSEELSVFTLRASMETV